MYINIEQTGLLSSFIVKYQNDSSATSLRALLIFEPIFLKLFSWSQTSMHRCVNLLGTSETTSPFEQASKRQYQPFSSKIVVIKATRVMYLCKDRVE